jgi:ABC-2 type transport system permease protein
VSKTLVITRREYAALFLSPVFWVLSAGFLTFIGLAFGAYVGGGVGTAEASMQPLLTLIGTVMLFVAPLLSMRLLSEEQRSGTLELLMTSPVRDWQVVLGKWLGAFLAYVTMIAFTLFYVGIMWRMATNGMAGGPLAASYLGVILLGAALIAVGTLTSSLTENQVVAAFLGIMAVMVLWFLPLVGEMAGGESAVSKAITYMGVSDHYFNLGQGVIDTRDLIYFLTITIGSLYLATRVLETRRWR